VAILVPALGTTASFYQPFAEALTTHGCSVLSPELPGTGVSCPRPSRKINYGYRDLVETYLPEIVNSAKQVARGAPVILIGHSLGAQVGTLAVASGAIEIDALVIIAGGSVHYRNWDGAGSAKVLFASLLFPSLTRLFGYLPGQYVGFGGPQARTLIWEWAKIIKTGSFSHITDVSAYSGGTPMLAIGIEGDTFAPEKSVSTLAGILGGDVEMMPKTWKGSPHSSWARNPAETVSRIVEWLENDIVLKCVE
jgi:predicted alpha/beta hydrolase